MDTKVVISRKLKIATFVLMAVGVVTLTVGFIVSPQQTWANFLLNNFYFLSIAIGASFWMALQYITQSGWSASFKRVPEAMATYLPYAAVLFLLLVFGRNYLYHWAHPGAAEHDYLIAHKQAYLNVPFWMIRMVVFFAVWILLTRVLRKLSLKEDTEGGMYYFEKTEFYSKVFIFVLAVTFSLGVIDWIMSIDVHWFSTLFALKGFVAAFHHGSAVIILIVILLNKYGYFQHLNKSHIVDFSRYLFMLAIVWGYFWFAEFMLIWYGNIPEETSYFVKRWDIAPKGFFFANVFINWFVPFIVLMSRVLTRKKSVVLFVSVVLILGLWYDLYYQIFPGTLGEFKFGFIEVGSFIGFAGLFIYVVTRYLAKVNLIPKNHPYLEESINHEVPF